MNDPIIADIHRRLDALETVSAPASDEQSVQQPSELALSVPLLLEWFPVESAAEPRNQAAEAEDEGEESTEESDEEGSDGSEGSKGSDASDASSASCSVNFSNDRAVPLVVCWVAPDGQLHHYYQLQPGQKHTEHSQVGHVFVLFREVPSQAVQTFAGWCDGCQMQPIIGTRYSRAEGVDTYDLCQECRDQLQQTEQESLSKVDAPNVNQTLKTVSEIPEENLVCGFRALVAEATMEDHHVRVTDGGIVTSALPKPDREMRVIIRHPTPRQPALLPGKSDWEVVYSFVCPVHPSEADDDWNSVEETVYVWGDLSFDCYGPDGKFPIHRYRMNQIVPQVMTGNCLDHSSCDDYSAKWNVFDGWIMQAQYYWQDPERESFAQCGPVEPVHAGEHITSTISYSAADGAITVRIEAADSEGVARCSSSIKIDRPFPNDPELFDSWSEFFKASERLSGEAGCYGRPSLNIEYKGQVKMRHLQTMCPFNVLRAEHPGVCQPATVWPVELFSPRQGEGHSLVSLNGSECLQIEDCVVGCGRPL